LRVYAGSFKAPSWLMWGIWFLRELGTASLVEPHVAVGGGVAVWAHVYGFGFGALGAAAIGVLGVERKYIRPKIYAITGELENPGLEKAIALEEKGRTEEAWRAARQEIATHPDNWDAILFAWDMACRTEREREMAPHFMRLIRHEAGKRGQMEVAWAHWEELAKRLPELVPPPTLELALAEGLLDDGWSHAQVSGLLSSARGKLGVAPPPGLAVKLARVMARAGVQEAPEYCLRLASDPHLPDGVRTELRSLAASGATSRSETL
jgi:hypothetical protein